MSEPVNGHAPEAAGPPLSAEEVRLSSLSDAELLVEFAGLDALVRFSSQAHWGRAEAAKPLVNAWTQGRLRFYLREVVRRAAEVHGPAASTPGGSRVDALLARFREEGG